jgi:hypothetical protein
MATHATRVSLGRTLELPAFSWLWSAGLLMFSISSVGECPECRHSPGRAEGGLPNVADLSGRGTIAGVPVRCLSAPMQFRGHTGYELPERQIADLELLRERFGAERTP